MNSTYITSDLHLWHRNILKYSPEHRPFKNIDEMHDCIVNKWNNKIKADDLVYIVGDISFGRVTPTVEILNNLNGSKILIVGNHDDGYLRRTKFTDCFTEIHHYKEIKHNGCKIVMFHYPIYSWNGKEYGSIHLHGHTHGSPTNISGKIMDVGLDTNFCEPYLLDDVIIHLSS